MRPNALFIVACSAALVTSVQSGIPGSSHKKPQPSATPLVIVTVNPDASPIDSPLPAASDSPDASVSPAPSPSAIAEPDESPSPVPSPTDLALPATRRKPLSDPIANLLGGVWTCRSFTGANLTHVFSPGTRAGFVIDTKYVVSAARVASLHETYAYDSSEHAWTATIGAGAIVARAAGWRGNTWTFSGNANDGATTHPFQMLYTTLASNVFRRDFQNRANGGWATYAGETCIRGIPI